MPAPKWTSNEKDQGASSHVGLKTRKIEFEAGEEADRPAPPKPQLPYAHGKSGSPRTYVDRPFAATRPGPAALEQRVVAALRALGGSASANDIARLLQTELAACEGMLGKLVAVRRVEAEDGRYRLRVAG